MPSKEAVALEVEPERTAQPALQADDSDGDGESAGSSDFGSVQSEHDEEEPAIVVADAMQEAFLAAMAAANEEVNAAMQGMDEAAEMVWEL